MKYFLLLIFFPLPTILTGQELTIIEKGKPTNIRGIGIYKKSIWVSGSSGYVGRSTDAGNTWQWQQVAGFEQNDFRDIAVINENTAIIMAIASPAYILKTTDGGIHWKTVYKNTDTTMFLDDLVFKNNKEGIVIGDPQKNASGTNSKIFIATTKDGGNSWIKANRYLLPEAKEGEAFFAASGSNSVFIENDINIVSGGLVSRLLTKNKSIVIPIQQGTASTGANSIAYAGNTIVITGGDFAAPDRSDSTCAISYNKGKTFTLANTPPNGYRSAVATITNKIWITCGINGIDVSLDGGINWKPCSNEAFNSIIVDKTSKIAYLAGQKGKVGKIKF